MLLFFLKNKLFEQFFIIYIMFFFKKAISPIVTTILLLIVSVISVITFQIWYNSYESNFFSTVSESSSLSNIVSVEGIFGNSLYINAGNNLSIIRIELDGNECSDVSGEYSKLSQIDISSCLEGLSTRSPKVLIITENSVISSTQFIRNDIPIAQALSLVGYNSTFAHWIGGTSSDSIASIVVDQLGNIYVGGNSLNGLIDDDLGTFNGTYSGSSEGFLVKFDSSGEFLFGQWFGDSGFDVIYSLHVDDLGFIYVAGQSSGAMFNDGLNGFIGGSYSGFRDIFFMKFTVDGTPVSGHWIGGSQNEILGSMKVDDFGNIYIAGTSISVSSEVYSGLGTFNGSRSGFNEGFLVKFNSSEDFIFGQWFGGTGNSYLTSVDVDNLGNIYVTGATEGDITDDGLTTFEGTFSGDDEAFLVKLSEDGDPLFSQWIGGSTSNSLFDDYLYDIFIDSSNVVYVIGKSEGIIDDNLGSFEGVYSGNDESYMIVFNQSGSVLHSRWIGGTGDDKLNSIYVDDNNGNIFITGKSQTTITDDNLGLFNGTFTTTNEAFFIILNSSYDFTYGQWVGGSNSNSNTISSIFVDSLENIYISGSLQNYTTDDNLVSFEGNFSGSNEGFFIKLEPIYQ